MSERPIAATSQVPGLASRLADLSKVLLDLLYPPRCAGCGRVGALFCDVCQSQLELIPASVCRRCGRPMSEQQHNRPAPQRMLCTACQHTESSLDGIVAVAIFAQPLRDAIHALKYKNGRRLAEPLGIRMAAAWREMALSADIIVPVPLHASRLEERGYNQSDLLAAMLSEQVGLPMDTSLVTRARATQPQVQLGVHERRRNVDGAFRCTGDVTGKRIALIDDVCTTGATLEACASALRASGAESVWGFTLARARWRLDADLS